MVVRGLPANDHLAWPGEWSGCSTCEPRQNPVNSPQPMNPEGRIQFANLPGRRVEKIAECMLLESLNRERRPPGSPLYWWALTFNGHWRTKWPALPQYRHNPWVKHSCLCCGVTQRQPSWMGSTSADWGLVALDEEDSRWCHGVSGLAALAAVVETAIQTEHEINKNYPALEEDALQLVLLAMA